MSIIKNILLAIVVFSSQAAFAQTPAVEVPIGVNSAFVPGGFDSTADVFVVVSGLFPNTCYSWNKAEIQNQTGSNKIKISSYARVTQGVCMMVLVPFQKEVHLGQLSAGDYTLEFSSGDGTYFEKTLHIEE